MRVWFWLSFAIALLLSVFTHSSSADSSSGADLIEQGVALRREGKDALALELFQRAQRENPSGRALAQIALAEQALGRWADAETHLSLVLAMDDPWVIERRDALVTAMSEVRSKLGTLEIRANRAGAEVSINGSPAGTVPIVPLRLGIGTYEVTVGAAGFKPMTRIVELRPLTVTRADFELAPVPARAAPQSEQTPWRAEPATQAPGGADSIPSSGNRTAAWVMLAGASALLIGSISAHVIRQREISTYNDDSRCLQGTLSRKERCGDHLDAANTAQTLALLGYAATGITLGASIFLFATDAPALPAHGFARAPRSSGAMLEWSGVF